ncbi:hypothetical protein JZ751_013316 [Albula glossodonta]|uniref:Uncharacterized protein n=1 Tax=Albula glossodonta TaxID=121402 RepID=A0A8T2P2T0_9TELE|nr:hypothetical protein JZ751_013316 [Albula glossodonta]
MWQSCHSSVGPPSVNPWRSLLPNLDNQTTPTNKEMPISSLHPMLRLPQHPAPIFLWPTWRVPATTTSTRSPWGDAQSRPPHPPAPTSGSPSTTAKWRAQWTTSSTLAGPPPPAAHSPVAGQTMWTQGRCIWR